YREPALSLFRLAAARVGAAGLAAQMQTPGCHYGVRAQKFETRISAIADFAREGKQKKKALPLSPPDQRSWTDIASSVARMEARSAAIRDHRPGLRFAPSGLRAPIVLTHLDAGHQLHRVAVLDRGLVGGAEFVVAQPVGGLRGLAIGK